MNFRKWLVAIAAIVAAFPGGKMGYRYFYGVVTSEIELIEGDSSAIPEIITEKIGTQIISWEYSKSDVVIILNGNIYAKCIGETVIRAISIENDEIIAKIKITVKPKSKTNIKEIDTYIRPKNDSAHE